MAHAPWSSVMNMTTFVLCSARSAGIQASGAERMLLRVTAIPYYGSNHGGVAASGRAVRGSAPDDLKPGFDSRRTFSHGTGGRPRRRATGSLGHSGCVPAEPLPGDQRRL